MALRSRRTILKQAGAASLAVGLAPFVHGEAVAVSTYKTSLQPGESIDVTGTDLSVVAASATIVTVASALVDPPPPPRPPGSWFAYPGTIPAGSKTYTGSGSLGAFLAGLTPGQVGVLDFDGTHVEEITGFSIPDGVMIVAAPGARPLLDGVFKGGVGKGVRIFGVNVTDPNISTSEHMVDFNKGDGLEFAYAEIFNAGCYTLLHPTGSIVNANFHHLFIHDNPGPHGTNNQDHGFYCSRLGDSKSRIHHSLLQNFPHGRGIKLGAASGTTLITGWRIDHCTIIDGKGPSDIQFSHGAGGNIVEDNVLIGSGAATCVTEYSGAQPGNIVRHNWGDKPLLKPTANVVDGGGNVVKPRANLMDFLANGAAGKGHLG